MVIGDEQPSDSQVVHGGSGHPLGVAGEHEIEALLAQRRMLGEALMDEAPVRRRAVAAGVGDGLRDTVGITEESLSEFAPIHIHNMGEAERRRFVPARARVEHRGDRRIESEERHEQGAALEIRVHDIVAGGDLRTAPAHATSIAVDVHTDATRHALKKWVSDADARGMPSDGGAMGIRSIHELPVRILTDPELLGEFDRTFQSAGTPQSHNGYPARWDDAAMRRNSAITGELLRRGYQSDAPVWMKPIEN